MSFQEAKFSSNVVQSVREQIYRRHSEAAFLKQ